MPCRTLVAIFLFLSNGLLATVLRVSQDQSVILASHETTGPFKAGDYLCVTVAQTKFACGYIIDATGVGAIVKMSLRDGNIEVGDPVAISQSPPHPNAMRELGSDDLASDEVMGFYRDLSTGISPVDKGALTDAQPKILSFDISLGASGINP